MANFVTERHRRPGERVVRYPPFGAGRAIKSRQAGDRTDPGDLDLGKCGHHSVAVWLEVTCRRKTSAARSASWSLVQT